jgi:hypothetical protein
VAHSWDEVREKWLHNRVFQALSKVVDTLAAGLRSLAAHPARLRSMTTFPHFRVLHENATWYYAPLQRPLKERLGIRRWHLGQRAFSRGDVKLTLPLPLDKAQTSGPSQRSVRGGLDGEDRAVAWVLGQRPELASGSPVGEVFRAWRQGTGVLRRTAVFAERVDRARRGGTAA